MTRLVSLRLLARWYSVPAAWFRLRMRWWEAKAAWRRAVVTVLEALRWTIYGW